MVMLILVMVQQIQAAVVEVRLLQVLMVHQKWEVQEDQVQVYHQLLDQMENRVVHLDIMQVEEEVETIAVHLH